ELRAAPDKSQLEKKPPQLPDPEEMADEISRRALEVAELSKDPKTNWYTPPYMEQDNLYANGKVNDNRVQDGTSNSITFRERKGLPPAMGAYPNAYFWDSEGKKVMVLRGEDAKPQDQKSLKGAAERLGGGLMGGASGWGMSNAPAASGKGGGKSAPE